MKPSTDKIVNIFSKIPAIQAIVLGGSHATGTASPTSDLDIGIYYDRTQLSYPELNDAAQILDDQHRPGLICEEGGWGDWMNFGGWLTVDGCPTDLIFRDLARVSREIERTNQGIIQPNYQTGHPHAYLNIGYRGELACCKTLFRRCATFDALKLEAEQYPEEMRQALLQFFSFEASFSASFVQKYAGADDPYYVFGHLFRSVSALNQILFALNRTYCLNEKKAVLRIETLPIKPQHYAQRIAMLFQTCGTHPKQAAEDLQRLLDEISALSGNPEHAV